MILLHQDHIYYKIFKYKSKLRRQSSISSPPKTYTLKHTYYKSETIEYAKQWYVSHPSLCSLNVFSWGPLFSNVNHLMLPLLLLRKLWHCDLQNTTLKMCLYNIVSLSYNFRSFSACTCIRMCGLMCLINTTLKWYPVVLLFWDCCLLYFMGWVGYLAYVCWRMQRGWLAFYRFVCLSFWIVLDIDMKRRVKQSREKFGRMAWRKSGTSLKCDGKHIWIGERHMTLSNKGMTLLCLKKILSSPFIF